VKTALAPLELLVAFGAAGLAWPLALDRDGVAIAVDLDVLTAQAGELHGQHVTVGPFAEVHWRYPARRSPSKQTLETLLHGEQVAHRIPRHCSKIPQSMREPGTC
jgi:hypothetical protein